MPATVGILGPTVVVVDGEPQDPGGRIVGRVLAALAIRRAERVTTERLIEDVWGASAPAQARASLQMHITKLRRLLEPTGIGIETVPDGYRLTGEPGLIDVVEFVESAEDARTARADGRWTTAAALSRRALSLWRADRIESLEDASSLSGELSGLYELRRQTLQIHLEARLALGEHEDAVAELEAAASAEPLVERWWELLMVALYRCGRQAAALATFKRASQVLGEELGIEPGPALTSLEERILLQDPHLLDLPARTTPAVPAPPPLTTPLIGRDRDIEEATRLLRQHRQVTILGPGGVGKTTLALEIGHRSASRFADGVLFWELTECATDGDVASHLAEQLSVVPEADPLQATIEHLRSRALLVIADNCEHVPAGAAAVVSELLKSCPDVALLATSRTPLQTTGEVRLRLETLAVPPPDAGQDELAGSPAVQLFTNRARESLADSPSGPSDLAVVGEICRSLDGLPLAVELAASWSHLLTVRDIAGRLDSVTQAPGSSAGEDRHHSLESAIGWSYSLLGEADRDAFERLAQFRAAFGLDAAKAVLGVDAPKRLHGLMEASLLNADVSGETARFRMLETIREFGLARAAERADYQELRDAYYSFIIETALDRPDDLDEGEWFERVQAVLADLRTVLDAVAEHQPDTIVSVAERLQNFWAQRGLSHEIEPRLAAVVEEARSASAWYTLGVLRYSRGALAEARTAFESGLEQLCDSETRARLVNALGVLALVRGDYSIAADAYREAAQLFEEAGLTVGVAAARLNQGIAALNQNRLDEASELFELARNLFRQEGDHREEAHALMRLAFVAGLAGEPEVGLERVRAGLRIARTLGPGLALADALQVTADFEVDAGGSSVARPLLREAIELFSSLRHKVGLQRAMITATALGVADEQWTEAAEMSAYSAALRVELGIPVPAANRPAVDGLEAAIADRVPEIRRKALAERARLAVVDDMVARCLDFLST